VKREILQPEEDSQATNINDPGSGATYCSYGSNASKLLLRKHIRSGANGRPDWLPPILLIVTQSTGRVALLRPPAVNTRSYGDLAAFAGSDDQDSAARLLHERDETLLGEPVKRSPNV
jgi:hypothetical protein